jgi:nucleoside-diphosphate-sugar epimerase
MTTGIRELVLGGDGLIGSTLIEMLRARGRQATSLDLKSGFDLRAPFDLKPFEECDRVWFLAWDTGGAKYLEAGEQQLAQYKNNCELSMYTFEAISRARKPFVFATSQLASLPNAYGVTKLMSQKWAEQLGGKIARLWNTYGWEEPDVKSHVVTDLVLLGLTKGRIQCLTDGTEHRRFIYKDDCAAALVELFDSEQQTADIAGPKWLSIREVAGEIARQLNVETVAFGDVKGSEIIVDPDNLLPNWQPRVSFTEGISKVISDARAYLQQQRTATVGGGQD